MCTRLLLIIFYVLLDISKSHQYLDFMRNGEKSKTLTDVVHSFSGKLYQEISNHIKYDDNIAVSPFSVLSVLLMMSMGSRGSTLDQTQQILNLRINDSSWHKQMTKLQAEYGKVLETKEDGDESLFSSFINFTLNYVSSDGEKTASLVKSKETWNDGVIREIFNAAILSNSITPREEYLNLISRIFQTEIKQADFTDPVTVTRELNARVRNLTRGLLQEALSGHAIRRQTAMVLVNALYFYGSWVKPFDKELTSKDPFFIDESNTVLVPIMQTTGYFRIAELGDLNAKAIFLPYRDNRHGLIIILPNKIDGLKETERLLLELDYTPNKVLQSMQSDKQVFLKLPKFKIHFRKDLKDFLREMGLQELLSLRGDLSGISVDFDSTVPKIVSVTHQSVIEVNEEGSEAAAVTVISWIPLSQPLEPMYLDFIADHPFLYYLVDLENDGIPLLLGRVVYPRSN